MLAVLWFSHALTTDCIRLQLRIFRKYPPSNPHYHLCNLHHCDHVHQGCGTSFPHMVWQNTVAIKDLRRAFLSCPVFQEDAGRTWKRFFLLNCFKSGYYAASPWQTKVPGVKIHFLKIFFDSCLIYCSPAYTWRWQSF